MDKQMSSIPVAVLQYIIPQQTDNMLNSGRKKKDFLIFWYHVSLGHQLSMIVKISQGALWIFHKVNLPEKLIMKSLNPKCLPRENKPQDGCSKRAPRTFLGAYTSVQTINPYICFYVLYICLSPLKIDSQWLCFKTEKIHLTLIQKKKSRNLCIRIKFRQTTKIKI